MTLCALSSSGKRTVGASDWCLGWIALVGVRIKNQEPRVGNASELFGDSSMCCLFFQVGGEHVAVWC